MQESYVKGVAIRPAPSLRCGTARCTASVNRGIGGLGIELRKLENQELTRQVELLPKNVLICASMWLGGGFLMLMFVKWALHRSAALYLLSSADGSTARSAIGS